MALKERQKFVLEAVILEHIKTAKPVPSGDLAFNYQLGVSPATIRNEMSDLDELGYLEQPHTSAGRIPTDAGYRFFVDYLLPQCKLIAEEDLMLERLFEKAIKAEDFGREFSQCLSRLAGAFSAIVVKEEEFFFESGLSEVIGEPEFREPQAARALVKFAEDLGERMDELIDDLRMEESEKIFIGRENPLPEAKFYTMILSSWKHPEGFEGFLTIISPKRTNYAKHKAIINALRLHSRQTTRYAG